MKSPKPKSGRTFSTSRTGRILHEAAGLISAPQRVIPLLIKVLSDAGRIPFEPRHLYSHTAVTVPTSDALRSVIDSIISAQDADGGIAAYYSLLTGHSESYPEVTGYIIPTLYDFASLSGHRPAGYAAYLATQWLLALQVSSGAFPGGLHSRSGGRDSTARRSVFNTGQILQGLVRAHAETRNPEILQRAVAAGDWLAATQHADGSWKGPVAYQGAAHTYYTMVSWSLAQLAAKSKDRKHAAAAERNIDWVLAQVRCGGWIEGINLHGHPAYLHFIAYAIQGTLECGMLLRRDDAVQAAADAAWELLRQFETRKRLLGAYETDFRHGRRFTCCTGNAQISCVWLRLFEITGDLRYLNAALKMNETLKQSLRPKGRRGVAGSYPIWGPYQPMRFISWGSKFLADALMLELRCMDDLEAEVVRPICA